LLVVVLLALLLCVVNAVDVAKTPHIKQHRSGSSSKSLPRFASVRRHQHRRRSSSTQDDGGGDVNNGGGGGGGVGAGWHLKDHCGDRNRGTCLEFAMCNSEKDMNSNDCISGGMTSVCCFQCPESKATAADRCGNEQNQWQGYCVKATTCVLGNAGEIISIRSGDKCPVTCTGDLEVCCSVKNVWKSDSNAQDGTTN